MKEIELLSLIPYGRENAVSRHELQRLTGMNDRAVRYEVKRLLRAGTPILSSCKHGGYWKSDDPHEIKECIKEFENKGNAMHENAEILRQILKTEVRR